MNTKLKFEQTKKKYVGINTETANNLTIEVSKFSGIPYWPKNKEYLTINNKPAKLMAQINLSEIDSGTKKEINLPENGILQFFFEADDDVWGLDFEDQKKSKIKVVYHENLEKQLIFNDKELEIFNDNSYMPMSEQLSLKFELKEEYLGLQDLYSSKRFYKTTNFSDTDFEQMQDIADNSGSKLGGYAYFTQSDPLENFPQDENWVLLLQIDTDENLMFGDSGVANWFIKEADLKNKDFSNVFFNWDCC